MAALGIDAELCLVDGGEGEILRERLHAPQVVAAADHRHALGGAQNVAGALGDDALLAGDQGDVLHALDAADAVINRLSL